ncbi:MAG: DUF1579 domain-containing protein [Phycisphaerales bacterium]|nr:DUF1579 domain-containing protein [Phycisphaerales bacterium]
MSQDPPLDCNPKPLPQHEWLRRFVGTWSYEHECVMKPGDPPMRATGRETVRAVGDLWLHMEGAGDVPTGGSMTYICLLGYDPDRQRFVGSWVCSAMTSMFIYEGAMDADGVTLPLNTTGPDITDPSKLATYQDVHELHRDDTRRMHSQMRMPDGSWNRFMTAVYQRVR